MTDLVEIIRGNEVLHEVSRQTADLGLPDYYIGAGCLAQTVWNYILGFPPGYGISDIDIVYYDPADADGSQEAALREKCQAFLHRPFQIDLVNQARVHLWYEQEFGYVIQPYQSTEHAINTWPTTATAIGFRETTHGSPVIYAPYGLNDLFSLIVRANKVQITPAIYLAKVRKWTAKWPGLTIIPWEG